MAGNELFLLVLQELQLSCQVGSCTSVSLPVKNGGNLPMTVRMEIPGEEESYISVHPPVISLQPSEVISLTIDPS